MKWGKWLENWDMGFRQVTEQNRTLRSALGIA